MKEGGLCRSCHDPHAESGRFTESPGDLCYKCHDFSSHISHPLGEGVLDPLRGGNLDCLSCHLPHGSRFEHFLLDDPSGRLCVRCHTDKIRTTESAE